MARNSRKSYEIDMLNGPILPKILRFSVPLTLSTMLQLLFNAADVVVVGRYAGDNSLAAVGSNTALINLLTNLFLGFPSAQTFWPRGITARMRMKNSAKPSTPPFSCRFAVVFF